MAGRAVERIRPVSALTSVSVADPATSRALDAQAAAIAKLQTGRQRDVVTADLVVGTNVIRHGLGRAVVGYTLTPTFATLMFAHALDVSNPQPEREVWITVVGSDQLGARVEVW